MIASCTRRSALRRCVATAISPLLLSCDLRPVRPALRICIFDMRGERDARIFESQLSELMLGLARVERSSVAVQTWFAPHNRLAAEVATEIAATSPSIVIAISARAATACVEAMPRIPILFSVQDDPVAAGLADSLVKPGGYATGIWNSLDVHCKRLELARRIAASATHFSIILDTNATRSAEARESIRKCSMLGLSTSFAAVGSREDILQLRKNIDPRAEILIFPHSDILSRWPDEAIAAVAALRLPAVFDGTWLVEKGALASLEPVELDDVTALARLGASILRGVPPANIPIERPRTTRSALNLSTANRLGLTIPPWLLKTFDVIIP